MRTIIKILISVIVVFFSVFTNAQFNAGGTFTGTATDLSSISNVTANTTISLTGDAIVNYHNQANGALTINGDLTFNSDFEKILGGNGTSLPFVTVNGNLTITGSGEAITNTKEGSNFGTDVTLAVANSASFTASSCIIPTASGIDLNNNGTGRIELNKTIFKKITTDPTQIVRFDFIDTPDTYIDVVLDGIGGLITGLGNFVGLEFKNGGSIDSNHNLESAGQSIYGIGNKNADLSNLQFAGNIGSYSLKLRNNNTMTINGFDLPLDQIGITGRLGLGNPNQGAVFFERDVSFKIKDANGNVESAIIQITDNRGTGDTFTTPVTYNFTTIADGTSNTETILLGLSNGLNANNQAQYENFESYGDDDDMDVKMTANIISYKHLISSTTVDMVGLDELIFTPAPLGEDSSITEVDKTIVDAYTTQETTAKAYDHLKAILVNNYSGETATTVTRNNNILNARNLNVVIDGSGTGAPTVSATTITLNAPVFTGNIITTGTVSSINGATIYGGYIDNVGTHKFVDLKWNQISTNDVSIVNKDDQSVISGPTTSANSFQGHFLVPDPAPTNGIEIQIDALSNGPNLYKAAINDEDLDFVRLDIDLIDLGTEFNQLEMLNILERLLAKVEGINNSMNNTTTPTITINETITNTADDGTLQNQETILMVLKRLLNKVTATREALKDE
ncbi:hypothetical protein [Polaribacter sp.]|uniref:hypothetical protein n=1 Tax=Polaribacter sp. TaxID=1920175 RepID=UPI003EF2E685